MPTIRSRGSLPYLEADGAVYFVTFRLADFLPQLVIQAYQFERQDITATAASSGRALSPSEEQKLATTILHLLPRLTLACLVR
jgi:hypothetical protein